MERFDHFPWITGDKKTAHLEFQRLERLDPQRRSKAYAGILDGAKRTVSHITTNEFNSEIQRLCRRRRFHPAVRHFAHVVPSTAKVAQELLVDLDRRRVLPESRGIVVPWRNELIADLRAEQVHHTGYRGSAAAVHAEDQQRATLCVNQLAHCAATPCMTQMLGLISRSIVVVASLPGSWITLNMRPSIQRSR